MANLKRYECNYEKCNFMNHGLEADTEGSLVKFDDIKEYLPSASDNSQMDAIALLEEYGTICNFIISNRALYKKFRDKWLEKVRDYNEKLNH